MKSSYFLILVVISLIFLASCGDDVVCETPYMRYAADCCLDQNNNNICDLDESAGIQPLEEAGTQEEETEAAVEEETTEEVVQETEEVVNETEEVVQETEEVELKEPEVPVGPTEVLSICGSDTKVDLNYLPLWTEAKMCQGYRLDFGSDSFYLTSISSSAVRFTIGSDSYILPFDEHKEYLTNDGKIELWFEKMIPEVLVNIQRMTNPQDYPDKK